jgi:hypothetical protein
MTELGICMNCFRPDELHYFGEVMLCPECFDKRTREFDAALKKLADADFNL